LLDGFPVSCHPREKRGTWVFILESMRWFYAPEIMPDLFKDVPNLGSNISVIHIIFQEANFRLDFWANDDE
jgi:hypothetical protein